MAELAVALLAGIGATVTPCVLPLYPAFLAFLTGTTSDALERRMAPAMAAVLVWAGVVSGMVALGAVLALLSLSLGGVLRILLPVADALLIALGLLLIAGRNPFARLPQPAPMSGGRAHPGVGAYLYGLLFAPIALPCSGPFLIGIFLASLTIGDAVRQVSFFAVFGIGFGLPLFVLGLVGQVRGRQLARAMLRFERPLQLILGAGLLAVGAWDLWLNLPQLLG